MDMVLSEAGKACLLAAARESIEAALEKRQPRFRDSAPELEASCGVFVTLRTDAGELRGCIGNLSGRGKSLYELVPEMALASAFEDPRFAPVLLDEIKNLSIEISTLSEFMEASPEDVVPGRHGILIRRGRNSGLLLPQVASEQGWDREQFLRHGCLKAGLAQESWKEDGTLISVFTALVFRE